MKKKTKQKLPTGWNEERVRRLAEHYDNQSEDDQVAEHEAAMRSRADSHGGADRDDSGVREAD
jgi:hypothetical protein